MKHLPDRPDTYDSPEYVPIGGKVSTLLSRSAKSFCQSSMRCTEPERANTLMNIADAYSDLNVLTSNFQNRILKDVQWNYVRHAIEDFCTGDASQNSIHLMTVANFIALNSGSDPFNENERVTENIQQDVTGRVSRL